MTVDVKKMEKCEEIFWKNPGYVSYGSAGQPFGEQIVDIDEAEARLLRFAPFISRMFPEVTGGIIESPLTEIKSGFETLCPKGRMFIKQDSHLPISGSVKARGGIYEVLKFAETLAVGAGLLEWDPVTGEHENYGKLGDDKMRDFFSKYKVAVGSTGNLGLSIGIISAAIGFQVTVHMSADARQWKKDMLRSKGVKVIEYPDDYEAAVHRVAECCQEWKPQKIVLGLPKHMNGDVGLRGKISIQFKAMLEEQIGLPVILVDERLTTVAANRLLISADVSFTMLNALSYTVE